MAMPRKQAIIVTDLGPGDGGKGGVVHRVATIMKAHTVIKKGGAQGSHGVSTSRGERFNFNQWGCGTLEGIRTHIGSGIVACPIRLLLEAQDLTEQHGVMNPFDLLTVERDTLCTTPFHGISSHLKELARKDNPRGTIGTGVGEAYRYNQRYPELSLFMGDLPRGDLRNRLAAVRAKIQADLASIIEGDFLPEDRETAEQDIRDLSSDDFLDFVVDQFRKCGEVVHLVDPDYFETVILGRNGVVVIETSHGILTDRYQGFEPHTSAIRTLPRFTKAMLRDAGYDGEIKNLAVHRGYEIRHGAGPMPTADPSMSEDLLPGSHKDENRWQGRVRVGPLDLVLMRYAIEASGGPSEYDGLAITWFDQISGNGEWHVCDSYTHETEDGDLFTMTGDLVVRHGEDEAQLAHTRALCQALFRCVPEITTYPIAKDATPDQLFDLVAGVLNAKLGVPVRMLSLGPTELDKLLR
ncbi:hypothetical protein CO174_02670 [Candidatus Uhrbacteria bacterium CG_4_9_14_3_um_filter_50_9]|uniref:AdSS n=1 Tax=Candidatus Uhrbacteria bacterium CG_4_9_14_3_um_filter_50_9 TaxID=1975035 RepID=A0A2M7XCJ2_9BACT|nr:MAG: hypothetical protein CO174_02670 [Candidatus Uhrbacteria bacterium CG_4_9_14_3_um_filter_50_9]